MSASRPLLAVATLLCAACSGRDGDGSGGADQITMRPHFFEGTHVLSGVVDFAAPVSAGTVLQLGLARASDVSPIGALDVVSEAANGHFSNKISRVGFRIENIADGRYYVSMAADTSGNGWIGEGDVGGYYAGSVQAPAQYKKDAQIIEVSGSMTDLDFGAGPLRCLAAWGEACYSDDDCRGASCVYDNGMRITAALARCTAGACETPTASCDLLSSGSRGTLEPAQCLGAP